MAKKWETLQAKMPPERREANRRGAETELRRFASISFAARDYEPQARNAEDRPQRPPKETQRPKIL